MTVSPSFSFFRGHGGMQIHEQVFNFDDGGSRGIVWVSLLQHAQLGSPHFVFVQYGIEKQY
jgi:hypothetical protein